jgi:hypothetical protein
VWKGDWSTAEKPDADEKIQLEFSYAISFHNYDHAEEFEKRVRRLQSHGWPIL